MAERYLRQMTVPEVGPEGQRRLAEASVLVVGAGGLGSPVLQTLAGAGVGRLTIVDHDRVAESNLHRQPLYGVADLGTPKALAARAALRRANPEVTIEAVTRPLDARNAPGLVAAATLVVDAADSFAVTYTLSDACLAAAKPFVSASALGLSGYAGAFCGGAPSYRAVFPGVPARAGNCATDGILGSVTAVLGGIEAHLALALLVGTVPGVLGRVITFDGRRMAFGGFDFSTAREPSHVAPFITPADVEPDDLVIDLRSLAEAPKSPFEGAVRLALDDIEALDVGGHRRVVLCCRSGQRALCAAGRLGSREMRLALVALGDAAS